MMSVDIRSSDRRRYMNEIQAREKEIEAGLLNRSSPHPASPKGLQENEKRMRREIANSNERRRMQCINAGFSGLKSLMPQLEGEKLSKAAILQHATEYITSLEKDKTRLQLQLDHTKRLLSELGQDRLVTDASYLVSSPPPSKRKKRDTESSDEGVGSMSDGSDEGSSDLQHENVSLRHQLEVERQRCASLEEDNYRLLAALQIKHPHSSLLNDSHTVTLTHQPPQLELFERKVFEVRPQSERLSQPEWSEVVQASCPTVSIPDHVSKMETEDSVPAIVMEPSSRSVVYGREQRSSSPVEVIPSKEASSVVVSSVELTPAAPVVTSAIAAGQHTGHHHTYCHRDHPRRRHRQQAQLELQRAEEEQRLQQEKEQAAAAAEMQYRPKNTQNLHNLVEAIRQIEGDQILGNEQSFYEDKHKLLDHHKTLPHYEDMQRNSSSVSDLDELRPESSGRDTPPQLLPPLFHHRHHLLVPAPQPQTVSISGSPTSHSKSSYSEKYPIAAHLLHQPLRESYFRPGVIVHK